MRREAVRRLQRVLLAGAALMLAGAARAQPAPTAALDRLADKAAREGTVRVLVGVPVDVQPEGRLTGAAALSQRSAIRAAQQAAVAELAATPGAKVHALFDRVPHFAAELDANALARLRRSPKVRSIEEDVAVPPSLLQSTVNIGADMAWATGRTGAGWAVAVLDTGVDRNHPFLAGKVVSEACYSTTSGTGSYSVCPGGVGASTAAGSGLHCNTAISGCTHGTHVAGIVAGSGAPDGSQGVAPGASLIAIQVFSHFPAHGSVMSYGSDQIKGLERVYALKDSFQIAAVNMSLGGGQYAATCDAANTAIKAAIDNLRSVGIATVIASGNNGYRNAISAPACVSSAISVGATCDTGPDGSACSTGVGGVTSYSNIAPFVSLLAPGSYIRSSVPGSGYVAQNGTSMAAPHVAGAWALLKHAQPSLGVTEALALLRDNGAATSDTRSSGTATDLRRIQLGFLAGTAYRLGVSRTGTGTGTISSAPNGIACGSDCSQAYADGTSVTLNPSAGAYSSFAGWSGDCSGIGACTLTMSADRRVTASFVATPFTLTVTRSGSGTVTSSAGGISCGSTCTGSVAGGTAVTLTATPATGSRFAGWSGSCTGTATTCTVGMTAARSVTATFAVLSYAMTVTRSGTGTGTVSSSPTGISCGATCTKAYVQGTSVVLTARATTGSVFTGWTGACSGTAATCTVAMSQARSVGAMFTRTHWSLATTKAGTGTGTVTSTPAAIACGATCSALVPVNARVTLTPTAAAESAFTGWSGACTGTAPCTLTMDTAKAATATFTRTHWLLTATRAGTGSGTVSADAVGLNCGSTCSRPAPVGSAVTLTATPALHSRFTGWTGSCTGTATTCTVAMTAAHSVTATFQPITYPMTATNAGAAR